MLSWPLIGVHVRSMDFLGRHDDFGEGKNDADKCTRLEKKKQKEEGTEAGSTCGYGRQGMLDLHPCFSLSNYRED